MAEFPTGSYLASFVLLAEDIQARMSDEVIGGSWWTALERPGIDEIVDDCFYVIYSRWQRSRGAGAEAVG